MPELATPPLLARALPESVTLALVGSASAAAPLAAITVSHAGCRCWPLNLAPQRSRPLNGPPVPTGPWRRSLLRCWLVHQPWRWPYRSLLPGPYRAPTRLHSAVVVVGTELPEQPTPRPRRCCWPSCRPCPVQLRPGTPPHQQGAHQRQPVPPTPTAGSDEAPRPPPSEWAQSTSSFTHGDHSIAVRALLRLPFDNQIRGEPFVTASNGPSWESWPPRPRYFLPSPWWVRRPRAGQWRRTSCSGIREGRVRPADCAPPALGSGSWA